MLLAFTYHEWLGPPSAVNMYILSMEEVTADDLIISLCREPIFRCLQWQTVAVHSAQMISDMSHFGVVGCTRSPVCALTRSFEQEGEQRVHSALGTYQQ